MRTHAICLVAAAGVAGSIAAVFPGSGAVERWSAGFAYAGIGFLAAALALGPFRRRAGRSDPAHRDVRRDLGIWSGALGLVHVALGLQVHMGGSLAAYFLAPGARPWPRVDAFGLANHAGLAAAILLAALLAASNDPVLRWLGAVRWKRLQRTATWAAALVALHGAAYQILERRAPAFVALFALCVVALALPRITEAASARRRG